MPQTFFEKIAQVIKRQGELPLIPVRSTVIFPSVITSLILKRSFSKKAANEAIETEKLAFVVTQKDPKIAEPKEKDLYKIGTIVSISQVREMPDGTYFVIIDGKQRGELISISQEKPGMKARVKEISESFEKSPEIVALFEAVLDQFKQLISLGKPVAVEGLVSIFDLSNPVKTVDVLSFSLDIKTSEKQQLLEATEFKERLKVLNSILAKEVTVAQTAQRIHTETEKSIGKMQREAFLREELKAIQKELGVEGESEEITELQKKIDQAGMPADVKKVAQKELDKFKKTPSFSPEISWIRTYLDWLVSVPWSKKSSDQLDIKKAKEILDADHHGLNKVKDRVLEYLSVIKKVGKIKGPILCFVGPPGTGKTSIGQSIAKAMDRRFIRMSLGGIRDEAEIRGHRRTYVGALPGRIIQGVNTAGTKNPVFMLDEIDKVGADFRGDPSSALLEALDPEQNHSFSDHYLEVPFDLSDVMFITTANILDTIPPALLDRMEVVEFPGYTKEEKFCIAKDFLIPKLLKSHGLKIKEIEVQDTAIYRIITGYTREAGVRNLERELASIFRKVTRMLSEIKIKKVKVDEQNLHEFLGPIKFLPQVAGEKDEIGVATGLAWTPTGGQVLFIESTPMRGTGNLILTGKLGEVMRESAQAALSYTRSKTKELNIDPDFYKKTDLHIHVPEGAIPKDGPSAGIAIAASIISALSKKPAKKDVGLTGEITLRGKILEIGGVKEKVLAAHSAGVKTIIMPKDNERDLQDIPENVKKELNFRFVEHMDNVLKEALV